MDFYLMELNDQNAIVRSLQLPMNPERIAVGHGTAKREYNIIALGEVKFPQGNTLDTFAWEGKLPGEGLQDAPYVKSWQKPEVIYAQMKEWMKKGTRLRLMVTETPINQDVYIDDLSPEIGSGTGSIDYKISLYEAKQLKIMTMAEYSAQTITDNQVPQGTPRPEPQAPKTYTVKSGDSLWKIAQKQLGKGSRYMEIYNANKPPLTDPGKIKPGQVLKLPV